MQGGVTQPHVDSIAVSNPVQLEPAVNHDTQELDHNFYAAKPVAIHTEYDVGFEVGISHAPLQSIEVQPASSRQEIRYIEHANPMAMQRVFARLGAKGYVDAFATINKKAGRCTIHLPNYVSTVRYGALKEHWLKHCQEGDYHEPGDGIEANPDFGTLLGVYADWLDGHGAVPKAEH